MDKIDIKSMSLKELQEFLKCKGQPAYRALQVYKWLHGGAQSFDEMSNLSKELREALKDECKISTAKVEKRLVSQLDGTIKYLFSFEDGQSVESVLMSYNHGYSLCISTQVGCKMKCDFCLTGKGGFFRNLTASEMLAQIQAAQKQEGIRISHIVLMGMGEPLDNYDNVMKFLSLVSSDEGLNIGMRHISLSTCGIVDKIYKLAENKLQLTLSVSLHAPNDAIRDKIMPINLKWKMGSLLEACEDYIRSTNRRISFEYAMIDGVNDSDDCARELAKKLSGMLCHVNLIPVNDIGEENYKKSSKHRLQRFLRILSSSGINATVRRTLGADINASCGQLRRSVCT